MPDIGGIADVIRDRIEPEKEAAPIEAHQSCKLKSPHVVHDLFGIELGAIEPLDRFDAIMAAVDERLDACEGSEPTIEEIVDLC
ncbi:hypothetical protein [Adlercreutzia sp. ZJ242]|uniref:hypothetical protein n=1 Tax=Adlercreutzia sp. ZJ242 TaxID=2709409 RepID=UPI0013EA9CAA|nr:hypothetical protein [Adlercreutzia sp. ZJ242]